MAALRSISAFVGPHGNHAIAIAAARTVDQLARATSAGSGSARWRLSPRGCDLRSTGHQPIFGDVMAAGKRDVFCFALHVFSFPLHGKMLKNEHRCDITQLSFNWAGSGIYGCLLIFHAGLRTGSGVPPDAPPARRSATAETVVFDGCLDVHALAQFCSKYFAFLVSY
jgi:hypothetical protein